LAKTSVKKFLKIKYPEVWACVELLSKNKNTMSSLEVWSCPELLSKNKNTMNSPDVWAWPKLLSKNENN